MFTPVEPSIIRENTHLEMIKQLAYYKKIKMPNCKHLAVAELGYFIAAESFDLDSFKNLTKITTMWTKEQSSDLIIDCFLKFPSVSKLVLGSTRFYAVTTEDL